MSKPKVILIICDGLGYREESKYNAVAAARTPYFTGYGKKYPFAVLTASGEAIGLPPGQIGTSEANHLVIGSGRALFQNLSRINRAVKNKTLATNPAMLEAFTHVKKYASALHIKGVLSDAGVHSHLDHLKELIRAAKDYGVKEIFLHLFSDGRDVPPQSAKGYVQNLEQYLARQGVGRIASLGGRYWGMDRDNNQERVEKHFLVMTKGSKERFRNAIEIIEHNYAGGVTDEFIEPASIEIGPGESGCIRANDAVIFTNFRSDRAKQITRRFLKEKIENLKYIAMTRYAEDIDVRVAFPPEEIKQTLSQVVAGHGLKQLKVTETEKYTHLTFFFNAEKYEAEVGEERIMVPSDKTIATYDEKPEMELAEIIKMVNRAIEKNVYDFIAVNLTNCDMVGHTGKFPAIVKAVEAVDAATGAIADCALANDYDVIITADHGNAEETFRDGQPLTAHTANPVPFYLLSKRFAKIKRSAGDLSDIAPTILTLLDLKAPLVMTGRSLV